MFCPVCKYEFRRGFTHCNQCDVDLVDALPAENEPSHKLKTPAAELDSPTLLWSGSNGGVFSEVRMALDASGIPYNREDLDARLLYSNEYTQLEVWVPEKNLAAAQDVLQEVLEAPAADPALIATTDVSEDLLEDSADDDADEDADDDEEDNADSDEDSDSEVISRSRAGLDRELFPEDATAEIWRGADATMADVLESCLAEIGIACYVERPENADELESDSRGESGALSERREESHEKSNDVSFAVHVLPEDENRARQIVRQITDASPQ